MLDKKQVSIYFRKFLRLLLNKKSLFFVLEAILLPFIISIAFNANEVFDKYHITRTSSIMFISAALWIGLFNSVTVFVMSVKSSSLSTKLKACPYLLM